MPKILVFTYTPYIDITLVFILEVRGRRLSSVAQLIRGCTSCILDLPQVSLEWVLIGYIQFIMRSVLNLKRRTRETCKTRHSLIFTGQNPVR
jgi:hypothetical protein